MFKYIPVAHPKPDSQWFVDVLMGRKTSRRPPLVEYLVDQRLMREITEDLIGNPWAPPSGERDAHKAHLDQFVDFYYRLGYDNVRYEECLAFPIHSLTADDSTMVSGQRGWVDQHHGAIATWEDFEKYPWPKVETFDFFAYEYLNARLPDGMGLLASHAGGPYEFLSHIFSYEGLSFALFEDPELVAAVADRIGGLMEAFYRHILDLDRLVAIFPGDDMGFKTATLVSPEVYRTHTLPWHKKFAQMTHDCGLPYFLHSCGQLEAIMEDLIEDVKIDGKHSYEDAIIPVEQFQARWGDRIAVLGGFDVHTLSTATPEQVRAKARQLAEVCGGRGRYALGSGNSIPSYVPTPNYLAMVDGALDLD